MGELKKLSHADDPATSKDAVRIFDAAGRRENHLKLVADAVSAHPSLTAPELIEWTGLEEYQIRRRLTDLKNRGDVEQGKVRKCGVKGTAMVTWNPSGEGKQMELF